MYVSVSLPCWPENLSSQNLEPSLYTFCKTIYTQTWWVLIPLSVFGHQPYCSLLNLVHLTEPNHHKRFSFQIFSYSSFQLNFPVSFYVYLLYSLPSLSHDLSPPPTLFLLSLLSSFSVPLFLTYLSLPPYLLFFISSSLFSSFILRSGPFCTKMFFPKLNSHLQHSQNYIHGLSFLCSRKLEIPM